VDRGLERKRAPGGFDYLLDGHWSGAQRTHQYLGDHEETWGNVTLDVDSNFVNGPVYPTDAMPAQSRASG
jgi:hypothetical protein